MKKRKDQNDAPLVTVVLLSYQRAPYTDRTLQALTTLDAGVDFELIVVDNGSEPASVAALQAWNASGLIDQLILLPDNLGTSAGFNTGFAQAHPHSRFLTKLDNDILLLSANWLREIVDTLVIRLRLGVSNGQTKSPLGSALSRIELDQRRRQGAVGSRHTITPSRQAAGWIKGRQEPSKNNLDILLVFCSPCVVAKTFTY
ncbi:MAG: glycosyltransferase [Magnetococcales bacterium]|nr:glycosyltransferase [Magnetococcales bacterium]